jgi:hypothetical protein
MRKIIILSFLICLFILPAGAQKLGVKAGLNINTPKIDYYGMDGKSRVGFDVGLTSAFNLPLSGLSINTGLLFSQQGFSLKHDYGNNNGITYYFKTNNLEVPLNVRKEFDFFVVKQFIQIGPYVSYSLSGRIKDGVGSHKMNFKSDGDRFDTGLNIGIGCNLPLNLEVLVNYGFGFTDSKIVFGDQFISQKNRNWHFSLGYHF